MDREPQFGLGKSIAYSLILIALVFGLAEGALRAWAYFLREQVARYDTATGTFVLIPGVHRHEYGTVEINEDGFVGAELEPEGSDLWRIVAVGDSCTFGGGNSTDTYPAVLDAQLEEREAPDRRYEVVNAGISGLDSEHALRRLRSKVPPLSPEVVTIYVGWNDLMKYDPLAQGQVSRWSGVARALDHLWLVKGLRKLIFFYVRPRLRPPATGPESDTGRFEDFDPSFYEANLREMLAEVREMGARPVLATLPTVVRPDMDVGELREANVIFPYFPSAYGVGDLLDLLAGYNRAVRRVAEEEGVPLADLAHRFAALPDPTPYFMDTMHTNIRGMRIIAEELESVLAAEELLGRSDASPRAAAAGS